MNQEKRAPRSASASEERRHTDSAGLVVFREAPEGLQALAVLSLNHTLSFPKGHLEQDETREACAAREVLEETGIEARVVPGFAYKVPSMYPGDQRNVYFFLGEYVRGEICVQHDELEDAFWAPAESVAARVRFDCDRAMYEAALAAYRAL